MGLAADGVGAEEGVCEVTIPVVFIHKGGQDYLRTAIEQAKRYGNYVVLLGNEESTRFDVEHHRYADYWHGARTFERLPFKNMFSNHSDFELFCFQRYFAIRDLAFEKG